MGIQNGSRVSLEYTLTVDGEVIDSTKDREPFQYIHGSGQIIPGLAKQIEGLDVGDEKSAEVPPQEAYGEVNPGAFHEMSKSKMPEGMEAKAGMLLQLQQPNGQTAVVRVSEVKEETVVLDLNHPLAGKTLHFSIKVVAVE